MICTLYPVSRKSVFAKGTLATLRKLGLTCLFRTSLLKGQALDDSEIMVALHATLRITTTCSNSCWCRNFLFVPTFVRKFWESLHAPNPVLSRHVKKIHHGPEFWIPASGFRSPTLSDSGFQIPDSSLPIPDSMLWWIPDIKPLWIRNPVLWIPTEKIFWIPGSFSWGEGLA